MLSLLLTAAALAGCPEPYTAEALVRDLQDVQGSLRALDDDTFEAAGERMERSLPCLDAVVPMPVYATVYRYLGAWYWLIPADDRTARAWFRASLELEPGYEWDVDELPPRSPMRDAWAEERPAGEAAPVRAAGVELLAEGKVYLDGRRLVLPEVTGDRPHLVQHVDDDGRVTTWRIDRPSLPEGLLVEPAPEEPVAPVKGNRKAVAVAPTAAPEALPGQGYSVIQVARNRPPAKTPLMVVGSVGVLAAGGVYGLALWSRSEFDAADTSVEAAALRTRTNALVIASGGTLLAGLGVGAWAVALDGGAAAGFAGRF